MDHNLLIESKQSKYYKENMKLKFLYCSISLIGVLEAVKYEATWESGQDPVIAFFLAFNPNGLKKQWLGAGILPDPCHVLNSGPTTEHISNRDIIPGPLDKIHWESCGVLHEAVKMYEEWYSIK